MKIIVCLKAVVDESKVEFDTNNNIKRETVNLKPNPPDEFAIEQALILKDKHNFLTIALTMGPENSKDVLRHVYSKGIDKTILISDPKLKGADCLITSKVLSLAIKKILNKGDNFLIFCGSSSEDSHTSLVPPQISSFLNIPFIPSVHTLSLEKEEIKAETSYGLVRAKIPCLFSFEINNKIKPRISPLNLRIKSKSHQPLIMTLKDIDENDIKIDSPTQVIGIEKTKISPKSTKIVDLSNPNEVSEIKRIIYG